MADEQFVAKLERLVEKYSISQVAVMTGYSYSYIHQSMSGHLEPGAKLAAAIDAMYRRNFYDPPVIRKTVTVRYDDPEQQARHLQLTNDERIIALETYLKQKSPQ